MNLTESKYGVKTRIIDVDFTAGPEIYDRIGKEIEGLEIGVLINNVGMSYTYPEYLAQVITFKLCGCVCVNDYEPRQSTYP